MSDPKEKTPPAAENDTAQKPDVPPQPDGEVNGPQGPEPTRYGDWEIGGRCSDF